MQANHAIGHIKWADQRLGPERVRRPGARRSMLKVGIASIFISELPGEASTPIQTP